MKKCPKCDCKEFIVTQHVTQTVIVDGSGHHLSTISECDEVTHAPDNDDLWECNKCGYNAAGVQFDEEYQLKEKIKKMIESKLILLADSKAPEMGQSSHGILLDDELAACIGDNWFYFKSQCKGKLLSDYTTSELANMITNTIINPEYHGLSDEEGKYYQCIIEEN